ncbi:MAG TPA: carbon-nitrogen hydrolase family protein [Verrucomicrobiae bacterium]|jgi:predicted amidohydrolase
MFKLALIQMCVEGGQPTENLRRAEEFIAEAAKAGAAVIVMPETLDFGWGHSSARAGAGEIPGGESCARLRAAAKRHGVYVCAGLVERAGDKLFNAAVFINPAGEILLHHRKLNDLDIAHDLYAQGDRLAVAHTPLGTFGVMICADAFARGQIVSRTLGLMGADIILSTCAWAMPVDHDHAREPYGKLWLENYGPVARDFRMWIAGCSNVGWVSEGAWKGHKCIGCSLVIGPDGRQVVMGPYGADAETVLYVEVELRPRPARGDAWEKVWR